LGTRPVGSFWCSYKFSSSAHCFSLSSPASAHSFDRPQSLWCVPTPARVTHNHSPPGVSLTQHGHPQLQSPQSHASSSMNHLLPLVHVQPYPQRHPLPNLFLLCSQDIFFIKFIYLFTTFKRNSSLRVTRL